MKLVTPAESAFLRREFDTLRQIRHENLIQVFDWGTLDSSEAYYTMELIEGKDWGVRMGKPQPADEVRRILTGLLRGLAHLHCHGEVHGDVKPANILLGLGGVVKLTDVGMGGSEVGAGGVSGTPGYAAPEVWEGTRADVRSDLYSVGVMGYEALTGRHPFQGKTIREVVSGQLEGWVPSPAAHGARAPLDLERVVMRALERDRGLRQGSADEFMEGMGVEDRVGVILGGKLVGREDQVSEILVLASAMEIGGQTLAHIVGPRGSGKTELVAELKCSLAGAGCQLHSLDPGLEMSPLANLAAAIGAGAPTAPEGEMPSPSRSTARLAEALWELGAGAPCVILFDPASDTGSASADSLTSLARYLWALSIERSRPARVLIVAAHDELQRGTESFETAVQLDPLDRNGVREQLEGLLGTVRLEEAFLDRLHVLTGGTPGLVRAAVAEFLDRGLLVRRDGAWSFHEAEQIKDLEFNSVAVTWLHGLRHLSSEERFFLEALTLVRAGIPEAALRELEARIPGVERRSALRARGWVTREQNARWRLQSDVIREAVASTADPAVLRKAASHLLERAGGALSREENADLVLAADSGVGALHEGLWAGTEAAKRGDLRLAQRRFKACVAIARRTGALPLLQEATLQLADMLQRLGQTAAARDALYAPDVWSLEGGGAQLSARREYLLALNLKSLGELDSAREYFERAAGLAHECADERLALRAQAELAEIDWGHRGASGRAAAIPLIRGLLSREWDDRTLLDERAALTYGLGAALIWEGQRREAVEILVAAFKSGCSDYWKMRIANALGAAINASGAPDESLTWLDAAWEYAEKSGADSFKARVLSNRGGTLSALGRYRDALQQDQLAALWGRRTGDVSEYVSAKMGAAVNEIYLGEYETAISDATEAVETAGRTGNPTDLAKALELKGLALFHVGAFDQATEAAETALERLSDGEYLQVKPRLNWLLGRLAFVNQDSRRSSQVLSNALRQLQDVGEPEDLLGIEVELLRVRAETEDSAAILKRIQELLLDGRRRGLPIVHGQAAVAIAEITIGRGVDEAPYRDEILSALEWAEQVGMVEFSWRLSYRLGQAAARAGDSRVAQTRFTHAQRILRRVADSLGPVHKRLFLNRPDIRDAIAVMSRVL